MLGARNVDIVNLLLNSGDDAFINEQYDYAYELYELALKEDGNNVKVLLHRSAAAIKMKVSIVLLLTACIPAHTHLLTL